MITISRCALLRDIDERIGSSPLRVEKGHFLLQTPRSFLVQHTSLCDFESASREDMYEIILVSGKCYQPPQTTFISSETCPTLQPDVTRGAARQMVSQQSVVHPSTVAVAINQAVPNQLDCRQV
jgi:hypothetical protein